MTPAAWKLLRELVWSRPLTWALTVGGFAWMATMPEVGFRVHRLVALGIVFGVAGSRIETINPAWRRAVDLLPISASERGRALGMAQFLLPGAVVVAVHAAATLWLGLPLWRACAELAGWLAILAVVATASSFSAFSAARFVWDGAVTVAALLAAIALGFTPGEGRYAPWLALAGLLLALLRAPLGRRAPPGTALPRTRPDRTVPARRPAPAGAARTWLRVCVHLNLNGAVSMVALVPVLVALHYLFSYSGMSAERELAVVLVGSLTAGLGPATRGGWPANLAVLRAAPLPSIGVAAALILPLCGLLAVLIAVVAAVAWPGWLDPLGIFALATGLAGAAAWARCLSLLPEAAEHPFAYSIVGALVVAVPGLAIVHAADFVAAHPDPSAFRLAVHAGIPILAVGLLAGSVASTRVLLLTGRVARVPSV